MCRFAGVNLLSGVLDLTEVSVVAIHDADRRELNALAESAA